MDRHYLDKQPKKPRKIQTIKPTKYEASEAIHTNKKYWNKVFDEIDASARVPVSEFAFLIPTLV